MIRAFAFLAALALATPLTAQTAGCGAQWTRLMDGLSRGLGMTPLAPGMFRHMADGSCKTSGLVMPVGDHMTIKADSLRWNGRDLERFVTHGLPPTAISMTVSGIRIVPKVGDPTFQYLQDVQARGQNIEFSVSADWDRNTQEITLGEARISLPGSDHIRLKCRIEGVDLSDAASMQMSLGSMGLVEIDLEVRSKRLFQNYLLMPLGLALLKDHPDPAARTAELKALAQQAVDAAPSELLGADSKAALKALLNDLPDPAGVLRIRQTATPGVGAARALTFDRNAGRIESMEDLWPLFDGIETSVAYERF